MSMNKKLKSLVALFICFGIMVSLKPESVSAGISYSANKISDNIHLEDVIALKATNKKVKMPERAVDGSRIMKFSTYDYCKITADTDGKYIYYGVGEGYWVIGSKYNTFKRDIKTGEETGLTGYGYGNFICYKNILLSTYSVGGQAFVEKISKAGKIKRLAIGYSPIGLGNSIYYIGAKLEKGYYYSWYDLISVGVGLYKMNVNGKRKKLVKKGVVDRLGTSGKNLYYRDGDGWINVKTGKPESFVTLSYLYDPASKTKFTFNEKEIKAGKYEKGEWKYKTVFKYNKQAGYPCGILSVCVCGGKILALIDDTETMYVELYMMDLDGKNKMLLHKVLSE